MAGGEPAGLRGAPFVLPKSPWQFLNTGVSHTLGRSRRGHVRVPSRKACLTCALTAIVPFFLLFLTQSLSNSRPACGGRTDELWSVYRTEQNRCQSGSSRAGLPQPRGNRGFSQDGSGGRGDQTRAAEER